MGTIRKNRIGKDQDIVESLGVVEREEFIDVHQRRSARRVVLLQIFLSLIGQRTFLDILRNDEDVISSITDTDVLDAVNYWEKQENLCSA